MHKAEFLLNQAGYPNVCKELKSAYFIYDTHCCYAVKDNLQFFETNKVLFL